MRTAIIALVSVALVAVPGASAVSELLDPALPMARYIVGFYTLPEDRSTYMGNPVLGVNEDVNFFVVGTRTPAVFEAEVALDSNVRYQEPDLEVQAIALVPNDTFYNQYQYSMKAATTNMELAWDKGFGTTSTKVCVEDTGQNRAHEDFAGATWYFWKDLVGGKTAAYDDNGHGTHTTGTIGAVPDNAKGVAGITKVSLGGVKALDRRGAAFISNLANGITECKNSGAHVQSHSWAVGQSDYTSIRDATSSASAAGQFLAFAAGNGGCTNCVEYPAKYSFALVAAVGSTGPSNVVSDFTSQGSQLDFSAPGESIPSTWTTTSPCNKQNGNTCYVLSSGTSMATPHVAGLAALVKSNNAGFTGQNVYDRLKATARDLGAAGFDSTYGWGLIQGSAA